MTMLTSWKLDPYTVMRLNSGRRGDDVLKGDIWRAVSINSLQAPTLLSLRRIRRRRRREDNTNVVSGGGGGGGGETIEMWSVVVVVEEKGRQ